ncbi:bifunctional glutamate N-acetyltransferase/amino-acid acetyltransferase ArgJ [Sulfitobacter sp. M57]|uniref:bifunctional glutamate N-acetyltransferase/amino-acid acetyltransferase ArgJ n=1 Tax=unclassified Sulfitobacter TaxID=196795 RepID=UPI0023E09599|nr:MULTISPECIES: bifunctional glutamate N-acetyltransferase/amino-acid acetyltransferase ArgJ [unclassified Sulfitobacter]MDF3414940.1 bifunctional glutamate N-acetyltransferase/amino-acid acetyltransferase ArgJ [Sulfitobacter sp. KE5]MDF3422421.1 bifunctional glutamate N-acetyltransferase/amino-acid acetyltransferase ArgJ [Sulfitobacter sp. KE43]MDF3433486.1 bifunctional glutamate N-acetyltransferase/amino-acid acetyltransferase ArgJ [Sulfitobacter sp. KE42]MDF3459126.1 bifunctional glutamate 
MGKITNVSPLAPAGFPDLPRIEGVQFATAAAGVKYQDRTDVMLAQLAPGTAIAGVFTRSQTRAAPVLDCQSKIGAVSDKGAAILVNSGNANAFTGRRGIEAVEAITASVAQVCDVPQSRVFTSSTGVIGEPLPFERVTAVIADAKTSLSADNMQDAAQAIMTTDTFPKGASASLEIDGKTVSIAGIAKGSGMIAPDMATMLVYIFTDALVDQAALQEMVSAESDRTFNSITVDSDTSTSDTVVVAATGASGVDAANVPAFQTALHDVMQDLAFQVVRDGEGATKFVEVAITGAASDTDAKLHAMAIANSPLVKTAIAGEDANWGRVVMAIGKSGAAADRDRLSIRFGDIEVAKEGWRSPNYSEADAAAHMKGDEILIAVDLGIGNGKSTVWTCDLTHGYIEINADYRS